MVGVRTGRLELDEISGYVGKKQSRAPRDRPQGRSVSFIALASAATAIVSYRTGKRDSENTDLFATKDATARKGADAFSRTARCLPRWSEHRESCKGGDAKGESGMLPGHFGSAPLMRGNMEQQ